MTGWRNRAAPETGCPETGRRRPKTVRGQAVATVAALSLSLGGCSTIVSGTLTIGDFSNVAGLVSTLATGKGIEEHVLSMMTGRDCRIFDGVVRADRKICEEKGSIGTDEDFKGVFVMMFGEEREATPARLYAQDVDRSRLDELVPDPETAPSMGRPVRRPNRPAQPTGVASTNPRLQTVLAAAAPVTQTRALVRTTQRPAAPGAANTGTPPETPDVGDQNVPDRLRQSAPSMTRTLRQPARGRPVPGVAVADAGSATDTLDRLEELWWPVEDAHSVVAQLASQATVPLPLPAPASIAPPVVVDYVDGGVAVEMVFGAPAPRDTTR